MSALAEKHEISHYALRIQGNDDTLIHRFYIDDAQLQKTIDLISRLLNSDASKSIVILPVEAIVEAHHEKPVDQPQEGKIKDESTTIARESLYGQIEKDARLNNDFLLFVALSTIVAGIGLLDNNVAVVIGAMVIAPLLGPNMALALSTTLGDTALLKQAIKTLICGISCAFIIATLWSLLITIDFSIAEIESRTHATLAAAALAFVSGAAGALSLATGGSSTLVGVMVAVALLPPTTVAGFAVGAGAWPQASGAFLLLSVNIVCVNLGSKIAFYTKGIRPSRWLDKEKAKRAVKLGFLSWSILLCILLLLLA